MSAYVPSDGDGFARSIVDEVDFRWAQEHRLSVTQLERGLAAAANDVFGRNLIDPLGPMAMKSIPQL
jgi:hypothetical protein